jgi:hypothetical protein
MCNATNQNCLALDYLLASDGGVCEKFDLSNCCLQIDDKKKSHKKSQVKLKNLPMYPSRLGEEGLPMTSLEDGSLPWQFQNLDRGNRPSPECMLNITMPGSPGIAVF